MDDFKGGEGASDPTRREFLRIATGAIVGIGFAGGYLPLLARTALGANGGEGDAGDAGEGTGNGQNHGKGQTFVWFDRGGWESGLGSSKSPVQGWGDDSAKYFIGKVSSGSGQYRLTNNGLMTERMNEIAGKSTAAYHDFPRGQLDNDTVRTWFMGLAKEAIKNAIDNNKARGGHATQGRVVGVGFFYEWLDAAHTRWQVYLNGNNKVAYSTLVERAGKVSNIAKGDTAYKFGSKEFSAVDGWGQSVDDQIKDKWNEWVHKRAKQNLTGKYHLVIIAVADDEPAASGFLRMNKAIKF